MPTHGLFDALRPIARPRGVLSLVTGGRKKRANLRRHWKLAVFIEESLELEVLGGLQPPSASPNRLGSFIQDGKKLSAVANYCRLGLVSRDTLLSARPRQPGIAQQRRHLAGKNVDGHGRGDLGGDVFLAVHGVDGDHGAREVGTLWLHPLDPPNQTVQKVIRFNVRGSQLKVS